MRSVVLLLVALAWAGTDARAAKLTKLAYGSTSIVYTHKRAWVAKSVRRYFHEDKKAFKLTRLERLELAAEIARLTRQLRNSLGSVVPITRAQRGRGVFVQRLAESGENLEYIWDEPRRSVCLANKQKLIDAAQRELGLPGHEEAGRDSWSIDTSDHNFLFDKKGEVISWFDPVFPPIEGWTGAQRVPAADGKVQREVRTLIGRADAPVLPEDQRKARAALAIEWQDTMHRLKAELGGVVSEPRVPTPGVLEEDALPSALPLGRLSRPAQERALREKTEVVERAANAVAGTHFTLDASAQHFSFAADGRLLGWQTPLLAPKQIAEP
jgi:hypothetical protein